MPDHTSSLLSSRSRPVWVLTGFVLLVFCTGTAEYLAAGALPQLATDVGVSTAAAGQTVTAYALGVAVGGPLVTILTARLPRKGLALSLGLVFIIGTLARGLLDITSPVNAGSSRSPRFMPMDLYRLDEHYVLTADLPGMDPGSIDVDFDNGTLTITAQRSGVVEGSDSSAGSADRSVDWLVNERFAGSYRRQVTIGDSVDPGSITASYDNGVLTVTLPLAEQAKSRKIAIDHGTDRKEITA